MRVEDEQKRKEPEGISSTHHSGKCEKFLTPTTWTILHVGLWCIESAGRDPTTLGVICGAVLTALFGVVGLIIPPTDPGLNGPRIMRRRGSACG